MPNIYVYTSAALNYLPKVRLLFKSIKNIHPEWITTLVLVDEIAPSLELNEPDIDKILPIKEIGISGFDGWVFCHDIVELATAVKPFFLSKTLNQIQPEDIVFYLDPDIVLFSELGELVDLLDKNTILLTPHQTVPDKDLSAIIDNEICSLKHGVYNLGFIGVKSNEEGKRFSAWWSDRLYHFCRSDIPNGIFTDQKWIDMVPAFFEGVHIVKSPRYNIAPWNLTNRKISKKGNQFLVNGEPVGFYHFTGFDSGAHSVMAKKNGGNGKALMSLIDWYKNETTLANSDPLSRVPWSYKNYDDGTPITKEHRLIYRERKDLQRVFKNPFHATGYKNWLNSQGLIEYPDLESGMAFNDFKNKYFFGLTYGFTGGEVRPAFGKLVSLLKNPLLTVRKTIQIFNNEGFQGVKKRITKF